MPPFAVVLAISTGRWASHHGSANKWIGDGLPSKWGDWEWFRESDLAGVRLCMSRIVLVVSLVVCQL